MDSISSTSILQKLRSQNFRPVIRIVVIALVVLAAIASTFVESETVNLLIIGLLVGVGVLLILLRYPTLGVIAIIPASFISPLELSVSDGTSITATVLLIGLMTVLWIFDMLLHQREIKFIASRTFRPLVIFLAVAVLSFGAGQLPFFVFARKAPITAQVGGLALFFLAVLAYLLTAHYIKTIAWLKAMTWVFIALGGVFLLTQLIPSTRRIGLQLYNQGALSSLFWLWMVALCLGQALYNRDLDTRWRLGLVALTILTLYISYVIVPGWKSGWVPALATIAVLLAFRSKYLTIATLIVSVIAIPFIAQNLLAAEEYSYSTRLEAWGLIGEMVKVNPILGLGPANYYWYTQLFPIRGYSVQFNSHNQFVDLLAQTGVLGLGAFLWFIAEISALAIRLRSKVSHGFPSAYVYAGIAGLVGTMVSAMLGDWFLPFVYNVGYRGFQGSVFGWIFLGSLVALDQIISKKFE